MSETVKRPPCARHAILVPTVLAVAASGCSWVNLRSGGPNRDPFVMSHLTHSKDDPLFAASDSSADFDEEPPLQSAFSVSRKSMFAAAQGVDKVARRPHVGQTGRGRAEDYRWIRGHLGRRRGTHAGWYIRYASSADADRYGGELKIDDHPRLGLLREGDRVHLEGRLVGEGSDESIYRVESIALLEQG